MNETEEFIGSGLDDYSTPDFIRLPSYKIINRPSTKTPEAMVKEHKGSFWNPETGDIKKELKVIPLLLKKSCTYNEGKYPNATMVCYSRDYFYPDAHPPISPICRKVTQTARGKSIEAVCPKAQWGVTDGKRTPPACKDNVIITFKEVDSDNVFQIYFRGMNLYSNSPLLAFIDHVRKSGKELYCFSTVLRTQSGEDFYPKISTSNLARIVTFNDVSYIPNWKDNLELVKSLKDQILIPAPTDDSEEAKGEVLTDDVPY